MDRRTLLGAGLALPAASPLSTVTASPAEALGRPHALARGLDVPWGLAFLPGGAALVSERDTGRIVRIGRRGGRRLVGHVPGVVSKIRQEGEAGLLGLALHPDFATHPWVYAFMSTRHDNRVVRMRYRNGELGRPHVLLDGIPLSVHHNGGGLLFGHGHLFVSTGDAEHPGRAQNRRSLSGKILRILPDGRVPRDNPFGNRVWSYGHRNVEGLAWDRSGRLWATEFGNHHWDELNHIRPGRNYGWPRVEGRDGRGGYPDPFVQWHPHACSPSGLAIVGHRAWIGALKGESLWSVDLAGPHRRRKVRHFSHDFGRIRAVHHAPDGSLWFTTSNRDGRARLHRHDDHVFRVALR
jgi:glucose/arabinose dehydrogenase